MAEHRINSGQLRTAIGDEDLNALRDATEAIAQQYVGHVRDGVLLPIEDPAPTPRGTT